jgi:hypothetical protein
VDRRTQRTQHYFGFGPDPPPRKPNFPRLVVKVLALVALGVDMVLVGYPYASLSIWVGILCGIVVVLYRGWRPEPRPTLGSEGWRMDPSGKWRWWNGSSWTNAPTNQANRKIGPEIEW